MAYSRDVGFAGRAGRDPLPAANVRMAFASRRLAGLKCAIAVLLMAGPVAAHAIDPKAALGALGFPGDTRTRVEGGRSVEIAPPTRSDRGLNVGIAFWVAEKSPTELARTMRQEKREVLVERNRRARRVHLGSDVGAGLGTLEGAITAAREDRRRQAAAAGTR
jgi:hypothetical protein